MNQSEEETAMIEDIQIFVDKLAAQKTNEKNPIDKSESSLSETS